MKKLINAVDAVLTESLRGFGAAHADIVSVVARAEAGDAARTPRRDKVALISGGGSGHEPMHAGFVGTGMLDAACPGEVFTSPTPDQMLAAAEAVGGGAGRALDREELRRRRDELRDGGGDVRRARRRRCSTNDDVAVESSLHSQGRRGVAATVMVEKIVGAAAERGADLARLQGARRAGQRGLRHMGVALTSCTVPAAGTPTFALGEDEMEMGVGIHGEPGRRRVALQPRGRDRRGARRRRSATSSKPGARRPAAPASSTAWAARR